MIYVLDTNVLLRLKYAELSDQQVCRNAVATIVNNEHRICLLPQTVYEFWNVCTRPKDRNGLGQTPSEAENIVRDLQSKFELLYDSKAIFDEWLELVSRHQVSGVQVHDARLAAAIRVHAVTHLITFNTTDFKRFGVSVIHPGDV